MFEKRSWIDGYGEGRPRVTAALAVALAVPFAAGGVLFAQDLALQPAEDEAGATSGELVARVEYGSHPERFGFKLLLDGGEPFARGLVQLEGKGVGHALRVPIQVDGDGHWERVWRDVPLAGAVQARFALATVGGVGVSNKVKVAKMPTQAESPLQRKAILVREVMKDPTAVSDTKGEWFELVNLTAKPIDLKGWTLDDGGSNHHVIGGSSGNSVWLQPQVPFVLGNNADPATNGGVSVQYKYTNFSLNNTGDVIMFFATNGHLVEWVEYDDGIFWPDTPGKALNLRPSELNPNLADDGTYWCDATTLLGVASSDCGTPGMTNDVCP